MKVGRFTKIAKGAKIGANTKIGPYVFIDKNVEIGEDCEISAGVVIGTPPLDKNYKGETSFVKIGNRNIIREFTTIHCATGLNNSTIIGDDNFIMSYIHIGHNSLIGNGTVITNSTQLAGYAQVEDFANIGGMVGVHQFVRIGAYSFVGACSYLKKDIPPYLIGEGNPFRVRGLNIVGLKRFGFNEDKIRVLRKAYWIIYRSGLNFREAKEKIKTELPLTEEIIRLLEFFKNSKQGIALKESKTFDA